MLSKRYFHSQIPLGFDNQLVMSHQGAHGTKAGTSDDYRAIWDSGQAGGGQGGDGKVQDGVKYKWSTNRVMVMTDQRLLRKAARISWPQPELMKFLSCTNLRDSSFHGQNRCESRVDFAIFPSKGSSRVKMDCKSAKVYTRFRANLPCNSGELIEKRN